MFDENLDTHPSQTGATHYKACGAEREQCMFDDKWECQDPDPKSHRSSM